jgi:hypothetical protein
MKRKLMIIALIFITLSATMTYAVSMTYTTTTLWFNVNIGRNIQVQTLSGSWISGTGGGAATSNNIEFNVTASTQWQNATILGSSGGYYQNASNPILQIQNIGTVDAVVNISINETMTTIGAGCLDLRYENQTYAAAPTLPLNATNVTLTSALTPTSSPLQVWLFANFSSCSSGSWQRIFRVFADYAS